MFWTEKTDTKKQYEAPDDVVDMSFKLDCRSLPVDHAYALSSAILQALPWFADEERAGVHLIHVAESGNGWMRPEDPENEVLCLSRRTRMTLRIPNHRIEDTLKLSGQTLDIEGHRLGVKEGSYRTLSILPTMFARYVLTEAELDEHEFLTQMLAVLKDMNIPVTKMMAGKQHRMRMPDGPVYTRSLMIAEMAHENAVKLQMQGIGGGRKFGCGLFIPQKGISAVNADE